MTEQNVVDVIIVTEQLEQIDFIEKVLKQNYVANIHQANQAGDIKRILDFEKIGLIIVDDAEGTLAVGSIRGVTKELHLQTPILQVVSEDNLTSFGVLMRNGASIVCPKNDAIAITANVRLLLSYLDSQHKVAHDGNAIENYRHKFDDLYQSLADPICYLQDGVFVDCNPAFLRVFEVESKAELQEMTIMQFVQPKHQTEVKSHLRKSTKRDLSANPVVFPMLTKHGNEIEYTVMSKPAKFGNENVVQVYMRSTAEGGGAGVGLYDETTGLANKEQMGFFLKQKVEEFEQQGGSAILAYILISNYRDVWGSDGFAEAEKFISAISIFVRRNTSSHTEVSRHTDDGLLLFIPNLDDTEAEETLRKLVKGLDGVTPEGMERMVEPICYVGFDNFNKDSECSTLISQLFRTARGAMLSGSSRVSMPSTAEIAQKDTKRLQMVQRALNKERIKLDFQPIVSFSADRVLRYADHISLLDEEDHLLDMELMLGVAERYQLAHHIDKWKMAKILDMLLAASREQRQAVRLFVAISMDSLKTPTFIAWLAEQMKDTGLGGQNFVFELTADNIINAYTGAKQFTEAVRECGAKVSITKIGSLSKENNRIIDELKPDMVKLDMREIDTLDEFEEKETMEDLLDKSKMNEFTLVAENVQASSQLARIWPYHITLAQGAALSKPLERMNFDFAEFYLV